MELVSSNALTTEEESCNRNCSSNRALDIAAAVGERRSRRRRTKSARWEPISFLNSSRLDQSDKIYCKYVTIWWCRPTSLGSWLALMLDVCCQLTFIYTRRRRLLRVKISGQHRNKILYVRIISPESVDWSLGALKNSIATSLQKTWEDEWRSGKTGTHTRKFFPTPRDASCLMDSYINHEWLKS